MMPDKPARDRFLNFDIDTYLNPFIPRSQVHRLPRPIAHFLGYRTHTPEEPPHAVAYVLTFLATVAGICLIGGVYNYAPGVAKWHPPALVASFGASAVLDYNTIRSPLAQPRNTIVGHTLSAIVAVAVSKGFQRYAIFPSIDWVAAAVACATANVVMSLTNTVHPPGGATAILACVQSDVVAMGWMYVPIILLASVLMCAVACLFNNTLRWYPVYWWTSAEVGQAYRSKEAQQREADEKAKADADARGAELEKQKIGEDSDVDGSKDSAEMAHGEREIRIGPSRISLPSGNDFELTQYEREFLGELQERLGLAGNGSFS